jgi:hypothetical protein
MIDSPKQTRDRAASLAPSDPSTALTLAREINDPWFACQALHGSADSPGDDFETLLNEAFEIGRKCSDPYRVVASAAWPARALIECSREKPMYGAGDRGRTGDVQLGKLAFYH